MLAMKQSITAIVVSHNSASVLPTCIAALHRQVSPDELLVVDNASLDASLAIARELGASVIANRVNLGFGAACNRGARLAKNEVLMFVNPDVCVTAVDVTGLSEQLARRPLGLVAPKALMGPDGRNPDSSMRRSVPWPCVIAREALGPVLPREVSRRLFSSLDKPGRGSWLSAALLFCARAEFLGLGGFDERLFLYYEDQELSARYTNSGLPLSVTETISACHTRGGSSGGDGPSRPIPRAASAMSSVEFVGITDGPRSGRLAWALFRGLRGGAAVIVRLMARGSTSGRSVRKLEELRGTQTAIRTVLDGPAAHYPLVKALAKGSDQ